MKNITKTFMNPVNGNKTELYIGTAKKVEEFDIFIKERGYKIA